MFENIKAPYVCNTFPTGNNVKNKKALPFMNTARLLFTDSLLRIYR